MEVLEECLDVFESIRDLVPSLEGRPADDDDFLDHLDEERLDFQDQEEEDGPSQEDEDDWQPDEGNVSPKQAREKPPVLTLLRDDELLKHGLVPAIRGESFDEEEEDEGGRNNHQVESYDDDVEDDGGDGFIRIGLSEEEYWGLQEQAWEEDDSGDADNNNNDNSDNHNHNNNNDTSATMTNNNSNEEDESYDEDNGPDMDENEDYDELQQAVRHQTESSVYDSFHLKVIHERRKTGFEETKELKVYHGMVLAGRYEVNEIIGSAAFSTALKCLDLAPEKDDGNLAEEERNVCIKVIKNNKDFFDQSLDEIRLLKYLNTSGDPNEKHIIRMFDYFYHKEHLFIVTELLGNNLYTMSKDEPEFFTLERIRDIGRQILDAFVFVHGLGLIHCDVKPENILLKRLDPIEVKLIDFGSSCFTTDHLSSYIQSRFYRAPEVVLGLKYDQRIDIWSLGCTLAELYSGRVLFECENHPTLLAKIISTLGGFPQTMLKRGRLTDKFFLKNTLFEKKQQGADLIYPRHLPLNHKFRQHPEFLDFIKALLCVDPENRPSADLMLQHPFLVMEQ